MRRSALLVATTALVGICKVSVAQEWHHHHHHRHHHWREWQSDQGGAGGSAATTDQTAPAPSSDPVIAPPPDAATLPASTEAAPQALSATAESAPTVSYATVGSCTGTRLPWDQPFANDSPYNIGIGTGAKWDTTSPAAQHLHQLNGVINVTDWSLPIFVGGPNDPLVTLHTGDGEVPDQQVHVPADAQPPGGTDRNMSFFDTTQPDRVFTYWGAEFANGHDAAGGINFGLGGIFLTGGDGFSASPFGPKQFGYNYSGGIITPFDLKNGVIAHALRIALGTADEAYPAGASRWDNTNQFPVNHTDYIGAPENGGAYHGPIPADSTFGIPATVDLSTLGLSQGGMMLAKALQDYGAFWEDTAGDGNFTVFAEPSDAGNPLMDQMVSDFQKLIPYLAIMVNQSKDSPNGGGDYPHEVKSAVAAPGLPPVCTIAGSATASVSGSSGAGQGAPRRVD